MLMIQMSPKDLILIALKKSFPGINLDELHINRQYGKRQHRAPRKTGKTNSEIFGKTLLRTEPIGEKGRMKAHPNWNETERD